MNKLTLLLCLACIVSCNSQKHKIPPKIKAVSPKVISDSIIFWRTGNLPTSQVYSKEDMITIEEVKQNYFLKKGRLYNKNKEVVSGVKILLRLNEFSGENVSILKGKPNKEYCDWTNGVMCKRQFLYNDKGNLHGYFSTGNNYNVTFNQGDGYLKDFYYNINIIDSTNELPLKEEGKVKNNLKQGKWIYYNRNQKIDSVKAYSRKDSVDVRFPHCLFNKKELCY
jgi:hypothetical protein